MPRIQRPFWTDAENELLRLHYPTMPLDELAALLPNRNIHGIQTKASVLGLSNIRARPDAWSVEHMAILREHYPTKGAAYVANLVGRSVNRVMGHANAHKIAIEGKLNQRRKKDKQPLEKKAKAPKKKPVVAAKPVAAPIAKAAPPKPVMPPKKASTDTVLLDARAARKREREKERAAKKKPFVTAADFAGLSAVHPARQAYTRMAIHGPAAASLAFRTAMQQCQGG